MVVGGRVDEVSHEHLHRAVLVVSPYAYLLICQRKESRYLSVEHIADAINEGLICVGHVLQILVC